MKKKVRSEMTQATQQAMQQAPHTFPAVLFAAFAILG